MLIGHLVGGPLPGTDSVYQSLSSQSQWHWGQMSEGLQHSDGEAGWPYPRSSQPGRRLWGSKDSNEYWYTRDVPEKHRYFQYFLFYYSYRANIYL